MKAALLLADGFEEIEALTPLDMFRRAGVEIDTIGITGKEVVGAHGISVIADKLSCEANVEEYSIAILPGGMPGAQNLNKSPFTDKLISSVNERGGHIGAICAAPFILGERGLLRGKEATCYPGFEEKLSGAVLSERYVVTDGNITTAKGMGVALAFSKELIAVTLGKEKAEALSSAIMEDK